MDQSAYERIAEIVREATTEDLEEIACLIKDQTSRLALVESAAARATGPAPIQVEFSEVRGGELQSFVRGFDTQAEANDFYEAMRRSGTPADAIRTTFAA
jgi:hypothetical protein